MKIIILLLMVWIIPVSGIVQNKTSIAIAAKCPLQEQSLTDVSGKITSLKKELNTNGLLVIFTANTCPCVARIRKRVAEICNYAMQNKIGVVMLNSNEAYRDGGESYDAMQRHTKSLNYNWVYALDDKAKIADAFGASHTPEVYLFDKKMKLSYKGAISDSPTDARAAKHNYLKEALDEQLNGKEISVKETIAIGCIIFREKMAAAP